jgi:hypothetical protein
MRDPLVCPILAMAALIFAMFPITLLTRINALRKRQLRMSYFQIMKAQGEVPEAVIKTTRNIANLFELPVLFFVACLLILQQGMSDSAFVCLAWGYVASRAVHSAIHITYNDVTHRLAVFVVSNIVLVCMWVRIGLTAQ